MKIWQDLTHFWNFINYTYSNGHLVIPSRFDNIVEYLKVSNEFSASKLSYRIELDETQN